MSANRPKWFIRRTVWRNRQILLLPPSERLWEAADRRPYYSDKLPGLYIRVYLPGYAYLFGYAWFLPTADSASQGFSPGLSLFAAPRLPRRRPHADRAHSPNPGAPRRNRGRSLPHCETRRLRLPPCRFSAGSYRSCWPPLRAGDSYLYASDRRPSFVLRRLPRADFVSPG